jgi:hypothetical protein
MKKIFSLFAVIVATLVFSGCGSQKAAETSPQKEVPVEVKTESGSVISSIKDAMGLGKKMKCTYAVGTGDAKFESTAYIEGSKYKSSSIIAGKTAYAYFDGEVMYSWMDGAKTGTKMTLACVNELKNSLPPGKEGDGSQGVKAPEDQFKDAVNTSCVPAVEAVELTLPSEVTFTDQCEVLRKTLDSMKNVKLPANVKLPDNVKLPANLPKLP